MQSSNQSFEVSARRQMQPYSWFELASLPKREPLVKRVLDRASLSVVYGPSGCGKTFFALDLSWRVALGWDWFGRKVNQGPVYYLSAEGGPGSIERRLTAFRQHHDVEPLDAPLYVYPSMADLRNPNADTASLIEEIGELGGVDLVVIDTLSRVMAGGNENGPDDMGSFVANVDRVRLQTNAHVLIVHHTGKDVAKGARGHSLLRAATDTEIEVSKNDYTGIVTATITKQRDYECGEPMTFRLAPVEIGMDQDEEYVTSCAVEPADAPGDDTKTAPKLTANQTTMFTILHSAGSAGFTLDQWNEAARAEGIGTKRKADLYDIRGALKRRSLVHEYGGTWYADR